MIQNPNHKLYVHFSNKLIRHCIDELEVLALRLESYDTANADNIAELAVLHGQLVGPLAILTLLAQYPDVINNCDLKDTFHDTVTNFVIDMNVLQESFEERAIEIHEYVGGTKPLSFEEPSKMIGDDEFENFIGASLGMATVMMGRLRDTITAEGEALSDPKKLIRVTRSHHALLGIMCAVSMIVEARPNIVLKSLHSTIKFPLGIEYKKVTDLTQNIQNRLDALTPQ